VVKPNHDPSPPRVLLSLGYLVIAAVASYCIWRMVTTGEQPLPTPPRLPLDFKVIQGRFAQVRPGKSREEVEELLGPPSQERCWDIDFWDPVMEAHPDRYPGEWVWVKWTDPNDEGRWIAVFFAGDIAYHTRKKGL